MIKKFPRTTRVTILLAALVALNISVFAQDGSDAASQNRPGIALVKPQAWSKNEQATVTEFESFTDRTAKAATAAGYYEFKIKGAGKRQVEASKVVKILVYPDPKYFPRIVSTEEREQVATLIKEINAAVADYPASKTYLSPSVKLLEAELTQYDSGKVKVDGVWQGKENYLSGQISTLGSQLRADIFRNQPASAFDLESDPRFVALQDMAATSPSANAQVKELVQYHEKLLRAESRTAILVQLSNTSISLTEAEGAVARLKALQADEDPKSVAFIKKWDASIASLKEMKEAAKPLNEAFEAELTPIQQTDAIPKLSPDLSKKLETLSDQARLFAATNPAPVLLIDGKSPLALAQVYDGFVKLTPIFAGKSFLEAKEILDTLVSKAEIVGPQTVRIVGGLQTFAADKIGQFTRQREEAQLLLGSGKKDEALAKFEEAYATIPDSTVAEEIAKLKPAPEKQN